MVLAWILVPVFIFILGPVNFANSGNWGSAVASTLATLWSALFIAAGIITVVFAVIERTAVLSSKSNEAMLCKFDPEKLPPLQRQERKPTFVQTFSELVFNVFGFVWLLLVPHHPWMILGPAASFLAPAPIWHRFYWAFLVLAAAVIVRLSITLARPQWAWFPLTTQLAQTIVTVIILKFILDAAGQTPAGGRTLLFLVVLADSVRDSAHYVKIAAIVNVSILISAVCSWFGLCIAGAIQILADLEVLPEAANSFTPACVSAGEVKTATIS